MAIIGLSVSGYEADAITFCDAASTTDTFIDEVPISIPNNNILALGYKNQELRVKNQESRIKTKSANLTFKPPFTFYLDS